MMLIFAITPLSPPIDTAFSSFSRIRFLRLSRRLITLRCFLFIDTSPHIDISAIFTLMILPLALRYRLHFFSQHFRRDIIEIFFLPTA
jgi:hypothetical protein